MNIPWKSLWKNKYVLAIVIFLILVLFIDDNNLMERLGLIDKRNDLKEQIEFYEEAISENNRKYEELMSDPDNLEKFAREEYIMKKDDEDVYIIVEKDED
ncbi:MAG: septum formation initiator family protein [Bacteroidales bacterium]|nr:septum formation initiator family protein [Bacteroidales bacterium]